MTIGLLIITFLAGIVIGGRLQRYVTDKTKGSDIILKHAEDYYYDDLPSDDRGNNCP